MSVGGGLPGGSSSRQLLGKYRFIVSDQYAPAYAAGKGETYSDAGWQASLLRLCPSGQLVAALCAATRVAGSRAESGDLEAWTEFVLGSVDPDLGERMRAVLDVDDGGAKTLFLSRQQLLLALRLALTAPRSEPTGQADPRIVATLLSHHMARGSQDDRDARGDEPKIGGLPQSLAMSVAANALFNMPLEYGDLIARTRLMWTEYEAKLVRYKPRRPLREMLREATGGLELDDILATAFALFAHAETTGLERSTALDLSQLGIPSSAVTLFLDLFANDASGFAAAFAGAADGEWSFLPFEERPLLRTGATNVLIADVRLLQRRFTHALYWLVHDHEKKVHGDQARNKWTQTYSELVELHAEQLLEPLAPTLLDGGSAFFTEEQVAQLGGSAADCGIDFGEFVLVADVVQHNFTVPTRILGDPAAFKRDVERSVLTKTKQLSQTIDRLLDRVAHPAHPLGRRPERIVPMVVEGAEFPSTEFMFRHIAELVSEGPYLHQDECTRLIVATMAELEALSALVNAGQVPSAVAAIRSYVEDDYPDSLTNHLIHTYGAGGVHRSPRMALALDQALDDVVVRLNLPPETIDDSDALADPAPPS